jgi:hypothetical protein
MSRPVRYSYALRSTARRRGLGVATGRRALTASAGPHASESAEQQAVIAWADLLALRQMPALRLLYAVPNGGYRSKRTAGRLKAEGLRAGVPDLVLPVARGPFHGFYGELKTLAGVTSPSQEAWLAALHAEGHYTVVALGAAGMRAALEFYLLIDHFDAVDSATYRAQRVALPHYDLWAPETYTIGRKWMKARAA